MPAQHVRGQHWTQAGQSTGHRRSARLTQPCPWAIKGRFVVFDLNSTGGTFVNGQRTSQSVLYPGDVISLAGVALIFGQDNPPPRPRPERHRPIQEPGYEDRPTAALNKDHTTADFRKNERSYRPCPETPRNGGVVWVSRMGVYIPVPRNAPPSSNAH
ncbi:MAG: FHA domain-containing protein [Anaerolineales bacterium]|nr:FHA domain-containing protein [Anaerolineales bacterium]